jgi:dTDP-4-dehydrorhamnose 3,5-epimerase
MTWRAGVELDDVVLLERHQADDHRGSSLRVWPLEGAPDGFAVQQVLVTRNTRAGTLRGLHFQEGSAAEHKIVGVLQGAMWDVVVDLRSSSPTYRSWAAFELTAAGGHALYVPAGFAHGYLTLADDTEVAYLIDGEYAPMLSGGFAWNDPRLAIGWPADPVTISERDSHWPPIPEGFSITS